MNPLSPSAPDDAANPLAAAGPMPAIAAAQAPSPADAYSYNTNAAAAWLAHERAISEHLGLWDDTTGMPTAAGAVDAAGKYANGVLMGTAAPKSVSIGGVDLPLNANGTVTLYHATNKAAADQIVKNKVITSAVEPSVYFSTANAGTGYGDHVVAVQLNPKALQIDDQFPNGRTDFRVDKRSLPVIAAEHYIQPATPEQ